MSMYSCGRDWTYDRYIEDVKVYGAEDKSDGEDYVGYFIATIKTIAGKFVDDWKASHDGKLYDHGWVGDAFAESIRDFFSDFYKDAYGQRPHLPMWFYIHPLGLPMQEDTVRMFCANPIEDAIEGARSARLGRVFY